MHDLLLAAAFVGMILSPLAFERFRTTRQHKVETSAGAQTLGR